MSNTASARKDIRQNKKRKTLNLKYKNKIKEAEKSKDLKKIYKAYDKATKRGIINPQRAGRKKSQASRLLQGSTDDQSGEASDK